MPTDADLKTKQVEKARPEKGVCLCVYVCVHTCVCLHLCRYLYVFTLCPLLAVEEEVTDQLQVVKEKDSVDEVNLTNLAPRKPDWSVAVVMV